MDFNEIYERYTTCNLLCDKWEEAIALHNSAKVAVEVLSEQGFTKPIVTMLNNIEMYKRVFDYFDIDLGNPEDYDLVIPTKREELMEAIQANLSSDNKLNVDMFNVVDNEIKLFVNESFLYTTHLINQLSMLEDTIFESTTYPIPAKMDMVLADIKFIYINNPKTYLDKNIILEALQLAMDKGRHWLTVNKSDLIYAKAPDEVRNKLNLFKDSFIIITKTLVDYFNLANAYLACR